MKKHWLILGIILSLIGIALIISAIMQIQYVTHYQSDLAQRIYWSVTIQIVAGVTNIVFAILCFRQ